ncbi:UNVERIFIED_ORG: F0F1-type ATP synthase assembly protein I [Methylobacterium sp. SuP10 SLI 274]|uniref:hypothetical protein n=1 Tax=Methylorubrum extorquens TaxID=408 RepID=UPI00209D1448|nr:hypothetical protein [Methylorubrum extorquens]MDF9863738.1 F0F1-type ATP synthase assembly protein I [Methylorubrum pseudosasae]MDH6637338.1 F0F1-type ATP synthase assembly protein I [Methylobacterium sp. SuP10 SLI 274]MDH6666518.1 F0F1-type ATP synthase assembly protein I [Methylorubrum zatmanii]MCP1558429.1 F0F1-type ATP synthase assembly protein I [Methylorubrum extorquens]MDF9792049.1 F0F1-type ATP synthase assembly protein I [Methylorubrum extorquens]
MPPPSGRSAGISPLLIILIGVGLGWLTEGYIPTSFLVGVTLTAFLAAYLFGLARKRDAEERNDRDE